MTGRLVLAVIAFFSILPFVVLGVGSLLPDTMTDRGIGFWPLGTMTWANHAHFWAEGSGIYIGYLMNTLVVSSATAFVVVFIATSGAYGLTRFGAPRWLRSGVEGLILLAYLLPPITLVFPYAAILGYLGLSGSLLGLVVVNVAFCFPFGFWLLLRFIKAVPIEFDHAAAADGAAWPLALMFVIVPRALPGLVVVGLVAFILSWNDVALSLVLSTKATRTLAAGVKEAVWDVEKTSYSSFAAASMWVAIPLVLAFGLLYSWVDASLRKEHEDDK
jgi:multiple sugar transport system permease protein